MIDVAKGSLLYRIALYGVFFEEHKLSPNGCPFIRWALLGLLLLTVYSIMGAFMAVALLTPILQIIMILFNGMIYLDWNAAMVIGTTIYTIIGVIATFIYMENNGHLGTIKQTSITTYNSAVDASGIKDWPLSQMLHAWHDKICPQLNFTGHTSDAVFDMFKDDEE